MAATLIMKKMVTLLILSLLMVATTAPILLARELPAVNGKSLVARLNGEGGGLVECWNALLELRSCTNEIIIFFLDGEMYLGLECCKAIRIITHHCWPSMLTSLGFTSEEGDVLRGYCDASSVPPPPASATGLSPAQAPLSLIPVVLG